MDLMEVVGTQHSMKFFFSSNFFALQDLGYKVLY